MKVRGQLGGIGALGTPYRFAGFELGLSGLAAGTFTYEAVSRVLNAGVLHQ